MRMHAAVSGRENKMFDHSREEKPVRILLISLVSVSACMLAQDSPLSTSIKMEYGIANNAITRSADKGPETDYGFKPTDDVHSFGQLVGHVAGAQFSFCSAALGEKSPATGSVEKTKNSKANLDQALLEACAER